MARKKVKTGGKKAAAERLIKEIQQTAKDSGEEPAGLDELIKSIQKEVDDNEKKKKEDKKKMSALVKVITDSEDKKEDKADSLDVEDRVLELLGIEDYEAELDYEQYNVLIKEYLAQKTMGGKEEKEGDTEALKQALKKSRGKKGKFKPKTKKSKVTASGFKGEKKTTPTQQPKKVQSDKLLPSAGQSSSPDNIKTEIEEDTQQQLVPLSKSLEEIEKNLQKILETNQKKLELEKQAMRDSAKKEETAGFKEKEAKLEGKEKKAEKAVEKQLKPVKTIFDMIGDFFTNVLLGKVVTTFLDFIQNPGKFLKGITDFFNSTLIPFFNEILKFFNDVIFAPINFIIDGFNDGINELEFALKQIQRIIPIPDITFPDIPNLKIPDVPPIPDGFGLFQQQEGGGEVINVNNLSLFDGGAIDGKSGLKITGMGNDTQLIAAQPGEVMMSKKAVDMFGADNLLAANAMAGGNNTPKVGKISGFQDGGVILGRQGSAPIRDFGMGSGAGSKGYIVVPGHAAGAGAPGEMELVRDLARRAVENLQAKFGPNIPVQLLDMHDETPNTDEGFRIQQDKLKELERQGYEVLEIHMDASIESGYGTGLGVIPPMPGTDAINPVEADFAKTAGAFSKTHRGGLAGTNRGISLIELGNMSPELQEMVLRGSGLNNDQLDALTKPLEASLTRGLQLNTGASVSQVSPMASGAQVTRQKVEIKVEPPVTSQGSETTVLPVPTQEQGTTSAASGAQGKVPGFNAEDGSNFDLIVVKSIYNIVG
jgi:hypothetical protein